MSLEGQYSRQSKAEAGSDPFQQSVEDRWNSSSVFTSLDVWLDLFYLSGKKVKWQSSAFKNNLQVIQSFIETYAVYKALHGRQ